MYRSKKSFNKSLSMNRTFKNVILVTNYKWHEMVDVYFLCGHGTFKDTANVKQYEFFPFFPPWAFTPLIITYEPKLFGSSFPPFLDFCLEFSNSTLSPISYKIALAFFVLSYSFFCFSWAFSMFDTTSLCSSSTSSAFFP